MVEVRNHPPKVRCAGRAQVQVHGGKLAHEQHPPRERGGRGRDDDFQRLRVLPGESRAFETVYPLQNLFITFLGTTKGV